MIGTTYNGHQITFDEDREVWECREQEVKSSKLLALKTRLDELDRASRRVDAVPVYALGDHYTSRPTGLTPAVVTLLSDDESPKAFISIKEGRQTTSRKVELKKLAPRTPEVEAAFEAYRKAQEERDKAVVAVNLAEAAIPRITLADLKPVAQPPAEAAEVKDVA